MPDRDDASANPPPVCESGDATEPAKRTPARRWLAAGSELNNVPPTPIAVRGPVFVPTQPTAGDDSWAFTDPEPAAQSAARTPAPQLTAFCRCGFVCHGSQPQNCPSCDCALLLSAHRRGEVPAIVPARSHPPRLPGVHESEITRRIVVVQPSARKEPRARANAAVAKPSVIKCSEITTTTRTTGSSWLTMLAVIFVMSVLAGAITGLATHL